MSKNGTLVIKVSDGQSVLIGRSVLTIYKDKAQMKLVIEGPKEIKVLRLQTITQEQVDKILQEASPE